MSEKENDSILLFDTLFTTNHLQIFKTILPYLEPAMQKQMAVYIKYAEFQYTISYYKGRHTQLSGCSGFEKKELDYNEIYNTVKGYCTHDERQKVEKILNLVNSLHNAKEMMSMMEVMKEMSSDSEGSDPMDMVRGMLTPEQQTMFEMFQNMELGE